MKKTRSTHHLPSGFWFLVSGFWFLVSGFWFLVSGFWFPASVRDWHGGLTADSWAEITNDIPLPTELLFCRDEPSSSDWVSVYADMKWTMPKPAYEHSFKDGRREIWIHADGALVRHADVSKLKKKEIARKIAGRGVHGAGLHEIFLGEIGWSDASKFFDDPYYSHQGWAGEIDPDMIAAIVASQGYSRERGSFDCSLSETISLRVPTDRMLTFLNAHWSGISATYVDRAGVVLAFDPSANVLGPPALLIRKEKLQEVLQSHGLAICWAIQGEKIDADGSPDHGIRARRSFHGLFIWDGVKLLGHYSFSRVESNEADFDS